MLTVSTVIFLFFATIFFYSGLNYALNFRGYWKERQFWLYSLLCFAGSAYAMAILYSYHANTLSSCLAASKFQDVIARFIMILIPWFIGFYADYIPKRLLIGISLSAFLWAVAKLILPESLVYPHLGGLKYLVAPWGESLTVLNNGPSFLTYALYAIYLVLIAYIFHTIRLLFKRGQRKKAWPLVLSLAFGFFAFANDIFVDAGVYQNMFLEEYAIFFCILLIGAWLSAQRMHAEGNYRTLFNSVNDGIFVHDAKTGMILDVNDTAARLFGTTRQKLIEADFTQISATTESYTFPRAFERIQAAIHQGPQVFDWLSRRADTGEFFHTEVSLRLEVIDNKPVVMAAVRDIHQRKKAEEEKKAIEAQMQQAQKLESLGLMAGGVAHDFNNLLGVILGQVAVAKKTISAGSKVPALDQITATAHRAAALCQQLLAYSGKSVFVIENYDLKNIVTDIARMLEVSIPKQIQLILDLGGGLPLIRADATQVRQVVMNLITNASEAIGEGKEGTITLTASLRTLSGKDFQGFLPDSNLAEGPYLALEVADTGCGMDVKTIARIFEPFFTTKFTGRGLGMAAVLGIVKGHGGAIRIDSKVGQGTKVTVLFPPALDQKVKTESILPASSSASDPRAKIMVVDDDQALLEVLVLLVEGMDFQVFKADRGHQALDIYRAKHESLSLVLMDLTMPDMDGGEVLLEMKKVDPKVPILLTSGYSEQAVKKRIQGQEIAGFMQKPFDMDELETRLRSAARPK